ncbi:MAG: DnaA/Hda family protein [Erythrobacter sp.]|uniref:HdaA/DnaA family protein n=1 Tax=Erythrobacter sp. TaxID=1042 RepID=UPI003C787C8F
MAPSGSPPNPSQIALPLGSAAAGDPERIVVGDANARALDALQSPESWPYNTAVLTGPPRSGKSLLGRWASAQDIAVLDDADALDEAQVFHRWNAVQQGGSEAGRKLLLIAGRQPWDIALPDLRSRLGGSLQLAIGEPDDDMAASLIEAHAQQRGLTLAPGAADYLVPRTPRSFAAIERLVAEIDRISLERAVPATMSVWRAALEAIEGPEQGRLL